MKPIYLFWNGRRAKNNRTGEIYIATKPAEWNLRLTMWEQSLQDGADDCPCPMPEGHIMFEGGSSEVMVLSENPNPVQAGLFD